MKKHLHIILAIIALAAVTATAQPVVTAFDQYGLITWTNDTTSGYYRVEWTGDLATTNWTASWSNLWTFGGVSSQYVNVETPKFYRLAWRTNAWPEESVREIGTNETDYTVDILGGSNSFINVDPSALYAIDWLNGTNGTNWARSWNPLANITATGLQYSARVPNVMRLRIIATNVPPPIPGMSWIFSGTYTAGDPDEQRTVAIDGFYIDKYELSVGTWSGLRLWATTNGYNLPDISGSGSGAQDDYPAVDVSWFDAVAWLNARSESNGLTAMYYSDATLTNVFRDSLSVSNTAFTVYQKALTNTGYRLPTEAEWERAARGFIVGAYFPWGGTTVTNITGEQANYRNSGDLSEYRDRLATPIGGHAVGGEYYLGISDPISGEKYYIPIILYPANGWDLYDMAGNVWEWCNDWYQYLAPTGTDNPTGPTRGTHRVIRGGSFGNDPDRCTVFHRGFQRPTHRRAVTGFRCVRSSL